MSFDPYKMPKAHVPGSPLGYDGSYVALDEASINHLKSLGYDPQDYRTAIAVRQVELYLQGCLLGTIEYDRVRFQAAESARKHFSKSTKTQVEDELVHEEGVDAISALAHLGTQPTAALPKRRGRPPGKKQ